MSQVKPKAVNNWQKLKGKLVKDGVIKPKVEIDAADSEPAELSNKSKKQKERENNLLNVNSQKLRKIDKSKYIGLDCEMVGLGMNGKESALARCCLVDFDGNTIYDQFVRPKGFVTDFRTKWSGVRKSDLRMGQAVTFEECIKDVAELLKNKILVGHALKNDLDVLMLSHPRTMIRDTAKYKPYMRVHGRHGKMRPRALKELVAQYLGLRIQSGEHNPAEDANSAMTLYRLKMEEWETGLRESKLKARQSSLEKGKESSAAAEAAKNNTNTNSGKAAVGNKRARSDSQDSGDDDDEDLDNDDSSINGKDNTTDTTTADESQAKRVKTKQQIADEEIVDIVKSLYEQNYNSNTNTITTIIPPTPVVVAKTKPTTGIKRKAGSMFTDNSNVYPSSHTTSLSTHKSVSFASSTTASATPESSSKSSKGSKILSSSAFVQTSTSNSSSVKKVKSIGDVDREMAAKKAAKRRVTVSQDI